MTRRVLLIALAVALVLSLAGVWILYRSELAKQAAERQEADTAAAEPIATGAVPDDVTQGELQIKLYFRAPAPSAGTLALLTPEVRTIPQSIRKEYLIRRILDALIAGPTKDGGPTIPKGTIVRQVFIANNLAVIDFSREIAVRHLGGVLGEMATVYSIVNSVVDNVPGIDGVRILVDGSERSTLSGHLALDRSFGAAPEFVVGASGRDALIQEENLE